MSSEPTCRLPNANFLDILLVCAPTPIWWGVDMSVPQRRYDGEPTCLGSNADVRLVVADPIAYRPPIYIWAIFTNGTHNGKDILKNWPDVSLRLALSIWIWVRYRENTWHTHTEKDTEPTIYRSPQCDTRSGLRSGIIKGMVTVYNKTIKRLCFNRSYHIVIEDVWNSLAKARGHNGFSLSLKLPYVYYI